MLRLVTQFDDHTREVTPATPSCCCCCCCLISIATSMTYAGADVGGRTPPEGADMSRSDRIAFAVLALPMGVLVGIIVGFGLKAAFGQDDPDNTPISDWVGIVAATATWIVALGLSYRPVIGQKALGKAVAIIAVTSVSFFVEVFVVLVLAVTLIGIPVYFVALVYVPMRVNKTVRKKRADEQRSGQ